MLWEYAHPTDKNITENLALVLQEDFNEQDARGEYTINQYKDGIFIGDGPDCSWIEEKTSIVCYLKK